MSKAPVNLKLVAGLLANVRFRDQSIKVAQYALKFLNPFLRIPAEDNSTDDIVFNAQQMLSNGRKVFRLFRSLNSLSRLHSTSLQITRTMEDMIIKTMSMIEDCLWAIFYVFDHQLFFFRTKLYHVQNEKNLIFRFTLAWFLATLTAFVRGIYELYVCYCKESRLALQKAEYLSLMNGNNGARNKSRIAKSRMVSSNALRELNQSLANIHKSKEELYLRVLKVAQA